MQPVFKVPVGQNPPNLSKDVAGYNRKIFSKSRDIRRALFRLGYPIKVSDAPMRKPCPALRMFQRDYNNCNHRYEQWGKLKEDGMTGPQTLKALEIAYKWSKKRHDVAKKRKKNLTMRDLWRHLCKHKKQPKMPGAYSAVEKGSSAQYVEVHSKGHGTLRTPGVAADLRVKILGHGKNNGRYLVYAAIEPQAGHPRASTGRWYLATRRPKLVDKRGAKMPAPRPISPPSSPRPAGPVQTVQPPMMPPRPMPSPRPFSPPSSPRPAGPVQTVQPPMMPPRTMPMPTPQPSGSDRMAQPQVIGNHRKRKHMLRGM